MFPLGFRSIKCINTATHMAELRKVGDMTFEEILNI